MSVPPNIVLIATDQWRGDAVGYREGAAVITPHLDKLALRSTIFERCISNSPLCVPARAAIMTGQLPRESGVWSNARAADVDGPSHVRSMRDAGYFTAVIGKTHLWRTGPGPKPGLHAKTMDHILAAWGFMHRVEVNDPIGTGSQGCAYTDYATEHGFIDSHRKYINEWIDEMRSRNATPWAQPPSPAPKYKDIDSFIGRTGAEWLRSYDKSQPFYLQVQFTGPHDPYDGPDDFRSLYQDKEIDIGITAMVENPPLIVKPRLDSRSPIVRATNEQRRQWRINYYANISLIDYWIGEILEALHKSGFDDNTWVLFTSDHGEMLGDLGLMGKTVYFEPSIHIPLLIRSPGATPQKTDRLVQQADITNTLLDISAVEGFNDSLGQSLKPIVSGNSPKDAQKAVISELFGESTVITDRYKLTVKTETNEPSQFIDRQETPDESRNSVDDPGSASIQKELVERYFEPLKARIDQGRMSRYRDYVKRTGRLN
ncbi:MAG: sulfatase-like hydrolase/transferase [Gammaproteobacteria bacterium]|nr:sulfatase-like hydrolase/transferase [Gammaproteobacteria bacterium]